MSDETTPQDSAAMPPASAGSHGLTLTQYERHCIARARDAYADEDDVACNEIAAVLDGLLERTNERSVASAVSAVAVLRGLEWSAAYSYCTGWRCCPVCGGIKPGHGADEHGDLPSNQGHRAECKLASVIH
jgi:hypothetical protein